MCKEFCMIKVSAEELSKISQFIASVNDMINGKFILADIKIKKILNMLSESDELYRYISECMAGFDFSREYHKAEAKSSLNAGTFAVPTEDDKLVALVFCILVECDAQRLDFYTFINDNFAGSTKTEAYANFAKSLLVPFKNAIENHFGTNTMSQQQLDNMTNGFRNDLHTAPVFDNQQDSASVQNDGFGVEPAQNMFGANSGVANADGFDAYAQNNQQTEVQADAGYNIDPSLNLGAGVPKAFVQASAKTQISNPQVQPQVVTQQPDVWGEICSICNNIESSVYTERRLKDYLKNELLYILKTIKYSTKYKDVKIVSALVTAFDEMSKKYRSIQFVLVELKDKLQQLYQ